MIRNPTHQHYIGQRFDHHLRPDTALHADRQGFSGVFVYEAEQALDYGITLSLLKECLTKITTPSHKLEGRHAPILIQEIHHEIKRLLFDKKTDSSLK